MNTIPAPDSPEKTVRSARTHFGRLSPCFRFALNPYADARFTRCPGCGQKTKQRTLPLLAHVEPRHLSALVQTCRYCPECDLLIAHQDQLGADMLDWFTWFDPAVIGNDYLVIGTIEREMWKSYLKESKFIDEIMAGTHDFAAVVRIERRYGRWQVIDVTQDYRAQKQKLIDRAMYTLETPEE